MLPINNEALIARLLDKDIRPSPTPRVRCNYPDDVVLARRLPPHSFLSNQAKSKARQAQRTRIIQDSISTALETPLDAKPVPPREREGSASSALAAAEARYAAAGSTGKKYEGHEVLKAIESHDLFKLYDIRSQQFPLLLRPLGGVTPLVYAMRLGKTHQDVAILLTGAFSKRVNDITDEELSESTPETKAMLRAIRTNLKIAISHGLASSDTTLLSSFLQVVIMSEGDKWILSTSHTIALALRAGPKGKPVATASQAVDKWVSRELKKSQVAAVGEYVANATGDLVLLGLWSVVTDKILNAPSIPLYFFARDDRIVKALDERVTELKRNGSYIKLLSKHVRAQIDQTVSILQKRNLGGQERIAELGAALDEG